MLRSLLVLLLTACGPTVPDLVAEPPGAEVTGGSAERGWAALRDRGLSRSGFACTDCHADGTELRPAPPLGGLADQPTWRGQPQPLGAAIQRCAERYQRRLGPQGEALADLVVALERMPPPVPPAVPTEPAALYDAACRGCHEAGPAGPVLGRPWPTAHLRAHILGPRDPGLDTFMPPFAQERMPGAQALIGWLAGGGDARLAPR